MIIIIFLFIPGCTINNTFLLKNHIQENENALAAYLELLQGKRDAYDLKKNKTFTVEDIYYSIRNNEEYTLYDFTNDGVYELYLKHTFGTDIIMYKNDQLIMVTNISPYGILLNNGAILTRNSGAGHVTYRYYSLDNAGNEINETYFQRLYDETGETYLFAGQEYTKEKWDDLTGKYLSVGSDQIKWYDYNGWIDTLIPAENSQPCETLDIQVVKSMYTEFLQGQRRALYKTQPLGVNNTSIFSNGVTQLFNQFALYDITGDEIPELFIKNTELAYILACKGSELVVWRVIYPGDGDSILSNRAILTIYSPSHSSSHVKYIYSPLNVDGKRLRKLHFSKYDHDKNGEYDMFYFDEYDDDGVMEIVNQEEWENLTKQYLSFEPAPIVWQEYTGWVDALE
ncbi:MAG: hypothetical protein LBR98_06635 [Syntrophomonadaceae bacterium]|nr:hypothetical protein [Syntrophomonadaceae bacterium]